MARVFSVFSPKLIGRELHACFQLPALVLVATKTLTVFLLLSISCVLRLSAATLTLYTPNYGACAEVSINGLVLPSAGDTITGLTWNWGDGPPNGSWFPASHLYSKNGTFTVQVTATSAAGETVSASELVTVTSAGNPLCPFAEHDVPTKAGGPYKITSGPDGALWFTEYQGDKIGRITTGGVITEYPVPTASSAPSGITSGPDGALWFTEDQGNKVGRITTTGVVTEYPVPTASSRPGGITSFPDGALWFTEYQGNKIGRITTSGAITEYPVLTASSVPVNPISGPDGALWFVESVGNKIGRIATSSGVITEYPVPTASSSPWRIMPGSDGALWFTELLGNKIGRITTSGVITEYPVPTASSGPFFITLGPDGALWFTENLRNKIGVLYASALGYQSALQFIPLTPCRVMDTRNPNGPLGGPFLSGGTTRTVPVSSSSCSVPATAAAYSINVTVVPRTGFLGYLSVWPSGQTQPVVSTLNSFDGSILANAAIVPAGTGGSINAFASNDTDLVMDIDGYFITPGTNSLQFYPLAPCRVLDTRNANGTFGGPALTGGASRSFPIPSSPCGAPATAAAYSLNVTVAPHGNLGYLTAWPTGESQPVVSTLNSLDGTILANAAIVPAGMGGAVSFFVTDTTDLVVDIDGYFAPPAAGGLNFYAVSPCRVVDTRNASGPWGGPIMNANTTRTFPLPGECGLPATAAAYSLNMTVDPPGPMGYLSVWPTGGPQPTVSTLNDSKGLAVANGALVPAGASGSINVYVANTTHVIVDTNGYFQ
jgi:virginiamycin B lyase